MKVVTIDGDNRRLEVDFIVNLAGADVSNVLPVAHGGTGHSSIAPNSLLVGSLGNIYVPVTMAQLLLVLDGNPAIWTDSQTFQGPRFETADISITLAASTNNWAPAGFATCNIIRLTASAAINLTGIAGGADGRRLTLMNVGTNTVTLTHNATSTAANQFLCPGSVNFALTTNKSVDLWYDILSSRWRVIG